MITAVLDVDLDFVDELPPRLRALPGQGTTRTPGVRGDGRPICVTETGDRYVAPDSHRPHGARAKYVLERCRCLPCTVAQREYNRAYNRAKARPDQAFVAYVDAKQVRDHLLAMRELGIGYKTIAPLIGVSQRVLYALLWPTRRANGKRRRPSRRVRPATAAAILSFRPDMVSGAQRIPAARTQQLVTDLKARGFYQAWIVRESGLSLAVLSALASRTTVYASTERAIEALHARSVGLPAPRMKSRWSTQP